MLDLIDLMNEHFEVTVNGNEISFRNKSGDHEFKTTIDKDQSIILSSNMIRMETALLNDIYKNSLMKKECEC